MRYFLISDNVDTLAGLRMVGVDGVVAHTSQELQQALQQVFAQPDIGLVLITSKLFSENRSLLFDLKLKRREPLLVEMPDRHSGDNVADNIKQYIQEAVGIKI